MKSSRVILVLLLTIAGSGNADDYAEARSELYAAYQAKDYAAMRSAAQKALEARPGFPGAAFNQALAEVLDGDAPAALKTLRGLLVQGIDVGVSGIPEFEPLQSLPGWPGYAEELASLNAPRGAAATAWSHEVSDFVPEGIAIGAGNELYLGSIRHGTIVRIDDEVTTLSKSNGHWSVFGMRLDGRGGLWFASASVPEYAGANPEPGRTGLFRLDLSSGDIDVRALLPENERALVLGDLVIAGEDEIYTTESLTGALYRYSISRGEFTEVIGPGSLRSMQGLVFDASGDSLYVSDYVGGLFRVELADNSIHQVAAPESVSLYGIDGLYRHGNALIAIQNGIRPHRVVVLELSSDGLAVTRSRILASNMPAFDEPTLGAVVGDIFYFIANSHWNRFDRAGNLPEGLSGPIVLKAELDDQR